MAKKSVFLSFHYANDVMRVQQIRNIGAFEGNASVTVNEWETVKRGGDESIKRWINESLKYKQCLIVLIGEDTANRPWVQYEIKQAWKKGMPILGVYIHNLKCPRGKTSRKGKNPFELFSLNDGRKISELIDCYEPTSYSAYRDIAANLEQWVNQAVLRRKQNVF